MSPTRERDEHWFTDLYATRYADVVRYGRRRLADADAADELAQEVFTIAWRRRREVPAHGLPWLYAVARRLLANYRRRAPMPLPLDDPDLLPGAGTRPGDGDRVAEVRAALATLSEPDQEILRLIGWEELTVVEALPTDPADLRGMLGGNAADVSKGLMRIYGDYAPPLATRAEMLRQLAVIPGFVWRGEVTDRAGRKGVAITYDDARSGTQNLLIFDSRTGALLGIEVLPTKKMVRDYMLFLATGVTDHAG
jgi:RNA polymerase sigma-70 factor (ECF subfamily)